MLPLTLPRFPLGILMDTDSLAAPQSNLEEKWWLSWPTPGTHPPESLQLLRVAGEKAVVTGLRRRDHSQIRILHCIQSSRASSLVMGDGI